ncbi:hypothetical protein PIB30_046200 [Stylosanthes scabra]|uniref:F-box domain-containing protein n=1 Tax=Stylosanthes scabra TaxID=79078 RepID=A0ABU6ZF39_9FABA|nr:hypothetical protein [Stylosanthes scabra]
MAFFFTWTENWGSRVLWRSDGVVGRSNLLRNTANDGNPLCPKPLPDDILVEILLRLPVKALLQFKRVCKSWRNLISSPQFAMDNFRQCSSANQHLPSRLVYANWHYYHCRLGFLPLQPLFKSPSAITKAPAMVCCACIIFRVVVSSWNPCTQFASRWIRIELIISLAYYGFGYDHVHDKYKLVTTEGQHLTLIYTFGANSCTVGPSFPYPAVGSSGYIGKFVSGTGTLNWMAKLSDGDNENKWVILSLDLANDSLGQVWLPRLSGSGDNAFDPELQVLRNCLCFTIDHQNTVFDLWMMKEYGVRESWMMISRIKLRSHIYSDPLALFSISQHDVLLLMLPDRRFVLHKPGAPLLSYPLIDSSSDALSFPIGIFRTFFLHHDSLVCPPQ